MLLAWMSVVLSQPSPAGGGPTLGRVEELLPNGTKVYWLVDAGPKRKKCERWTVVERTPSVRGRSIERIEPVSDGSWVHRYTLALGDEDLYLEGPSREKFDAAGKARESSAYGCARQLRFAGVTEREIRWQTRTWYRTLAACEGARQNRSPESPGGCR